MILDNFGPWAVLWFWAFENFQNKITCTLGFFDNFFSKNQWFRVGYFTGSLIFENCGSISEPVL
jgi:hypothetical protein